MLQQIALWLYDQKDRFTNENRQLMHIFKTGYMQRINLKFDLHTYSNMVA